MCTPHGCLLSTHHSYICLLQGSLPPLVATCLIEEMESPLHFSISGQVAGMTVHFELLKESGEEQQHQEQRGAEPNK